MKRTAFTLVELLIVIAIIILLMGMTALTVAGVTETAKVSRTKGIISVLNDVVLTRYESYKTRPLALSVPQPSSSDVATEIAPREAARIRLIMIRDLMRMEMPDRKIDVIDGPMSIRGAVTPVRFVDGGGPTGNGGYSRATPVDYQIGWYSGNSNPALQLAYRDRVPRDPTTGAINYDAWTREWESAEALYLIVATTFMDGLPALESIPSRNIGDVDGDQMPEILDGWGTPIGFIRWPVDYLDAITGTLDANGQPTGLTRTDDELDPFKVDFGFIASNAPAIATGSSSSTPFSLRPLVVSAGSDRTFDLRFGYGTTNDGSDDVRYASMTWSTSVMGSGVDSLGRGNSYPYIDPYQRGMTSLDRLGSFFDQDNDGDEQRADNITNFTLEISE